MRSYYGPSTPTVFGATGDIDPVCMTVWHNLGAMTQAVSRVSSCLDLFDAIEVSVARADKRHRVGMVQWLFIVAENIPLKLYELSKLMKATRDECEGLPAFKERIDYARMDRASELFEAAFPGWRDLRQVAAHGAERTDRPGKRADESIKGPYKNEFMTMAAGDMILGGTLAGRRYFAGRRGKEVSFVVSDKLVEDLDRVVRTYFGAFLRVSCETLNAALPIGLGQMEEERLRGEYLID